MLAECYRLSGRSVEGLEAVADGLAHACKTGERNFEARFYHVKGELLLMQNSCSAKEAESSFRTGIDIARRQEAKFLELRATTSLARLLQNQGRRDEPRAMLADIYGWFTEGFDTADLKEAKALLAELGG
jgi:predicted ATPase